METSIWQARYYDGHSAAFHAATVTLGPVAIGFESEGESHSWPYYEVSQTSGYYPGEPVRLEHGAEAVAVDDPLFRDAIKKRSRSFKRRPLAGRRLMLWLPILLILGLGSTGLL